MTALGSYGSAAAVALQADGKILAAGSSLGSPGSQPSPGISSQPRARSQKDLSSVEYGQSVQLTGVLTIRQPGWLSVRARRCGDSADKTAADTSVGANGIWAVSLVPEDQTEYQGRCRARAKRGCHGGGTPAADSGASLIQVTARAGPLRPHARRRKHHPPAASKRTGPLDRPESLPMRRISIRGPRIVSGGTFRVQRRPGRKLRIVLRREGRYDCFETAVSPRFAAREPGRRLSPAGRPGRSRPGRRQGRPGCSRPRARCGDP